MITATLSRQPLPLPARHAFDFCKILDFGLVKHCLPGDSTLLTATGATTGTPAFMAPEIATSNTFDSRTDIYGLGCVAYWLLNRAPSL